MNEKLQANILPILHRYKSPNHMLKGNNMILQRLGYKNFPELSLAFCQGVVFSEIAIQVDLHCYPHPPDEKTMLEATELFLSFIRREFE
jgi:hypothetical protein